MRKRELERRLEAVPGFEDPDPSLEQYPTPAVIAADILFDAYARGDIAGMKVIDLGCGTGMFAIGAALLGAGAVTGYDVSPAAVSIARRTAAEMGCDVRFEVSDVGDVDDGADTVLMNPPFGCQSRSADRRFLDKAMDLAECVYSLHMAGTLEFVDGYVRRRGRRIAHDKTYKYHIPHTFRFHRKERRTIDVVVVNIR